jgi:phosphate starvation-inducible protein PhoH
MNRFNFIEFNEKDIVRSDLVKDYIIKKEAFDIQANISQ